MTYKDRPDTVRLTLLGPPRREFDSSSHSLNQSTSNQDTDKMMNASSAETFTVLSFEDMEVSLLYCTVLYCTVLYCFGQSSLLLISSDH